MHPTSQANRNLFYIYFNRNTYGYSGRSLSLLFAKAKNTDRASVDLESQSKLGVLAHDDPRVNKRQTHGRSTETWTQTTVTIAIRCSEVDDGWYRRVDGRLLYVCSYIHIVRYLWLTHPSAKCGIIWQTSGAAKGNSLDSCKVCKG